MPEVKPEQPLFADAFLIDRAIIEPPGLADLLKKHTRGWPARHHYRGQVIGRKAFLYITPTGECCLKYPTNSPRHGQSRYAWKDLKPGVQIGVIEDEKERQIHAERIAAEIKRWG